MTSSKQYISCESKKIGSHNKIQIFNTIMINLIPIAACSFGQSYHVKYNGASEGVKRKPPIDI